MPAPRRDTDSQIGGRDVQEPRSLLKPNRELRQTVVHGNDGLSVGCNPTSLAADSRYQRPISENVIQDRVLRSGLKTINLAPPLSAQKEVQNADRDRSSSRPGNAGRVHHDRIRRTGADAGSRDSPRRSPLAGTRAQARELPAALLHQRPREQAVGTTRCRTSTHINLETDISRAAPNP